MKNEATQEAKDVKIVKLLEQVKLRDEKIKADKLPQHNSPALTLSEKVFVEIRQSFNKLDRDYTVSLLFLLYYSYPVALKY